MLPQVPLPAFPPEASCGRRWQRDVATAGRPAAIVAIVPALDWSTTCGWCRPQRPGLRQSSVSQYCIPNEVAQSLYLPCQRPMWEADLLFLAIAAKLDARPGCAAAIFAVLSQVAADIGTMDPGLEGHAAPSMAGVVGRDTVEAQSVGHAQVSWPASVCMVYYS